MFCKTSVFDPYHSLFKIFAPYTSFSIFSTGANFGFACIYDEVCLRLKWLRMHSEFFFIFPECFLHAFMALLTALNLFLVMALLVTMIHYLIPMTMFRIRMNRVPNADMPTEKDLKKIGRGTMVEKIAIVDDVKLSLVSWYDNKVVNLLSAFVGSEPTSTKTRYFRKDKQYKDITSPHGRR